MGGQELDDRATNRYRERHGVALQLVTVPFVKIKRRCYFLILKYISRALFLRGLVFHVQFAIWVLG